MEINTLSATFLKTAYVLDAITLMRACRNMNLFNIGSVLGEYFMSIFPKNIDIIDEYAMSLYYTRRRPQSFDVARQMIDIRGIGEFQITRYNTNVRFNIPSVRDRYIYYNLDKVLEIGKLTKSKGKNMLKMVTFTITTCKRFDLFEKTMNSFINACNDLHLIDTWVCVDDNSSGEDRAKMMNLYPFFTFYFKNENEKGHARSMNIIKELVATPYMFHMEDDWQFFMKANYIGDCLEVIGNDARIQQCLINKNYAETEDDVSIAGGVYTHTFNGLPYYIHEYYTPGSSQMNIFLQKYSGMKTCAYWPHFSFRPSLIRTGALNTIGSFDEGGGHFEMEYSNRWLAHEYMSAFLPSIYCLHIGKLTTDKSSGNAYTLNGERQFGKTGQSESKGEDVKGNRFIINLDRRPEKWVKYSNKNFTRVSAVDGDTLKITPRIKSLFNNNTYDWRQGMIGCALTHIKLWIELLYSERHNEYYIFEDDIEFVSDFDAKLSKVAGTQGWDVLVLGHHLYKNHFTSFAHNQTVIPDIEKWSALMTIQKSMGGTFGYGITKKGAEKLLTFINKHGMVNCIDTMIQQAADSAEIYYCNPHLVYSKHPLDINTSDIQASFKSVNIDGVDADPDRLIDRKTGMFTL